MQKSVKVVGIGGSSRPGSTVERALRLVLGEAARLGAEVSLVGGAELELPLFDPRTAAGRRPPARRLLAEVAAADGVVLASPAYHGTVSGLLKNALDHLEQLRDDVRPYMSGRAVGSVAVGQGWQGAVTTLGALRDAAHALRGWNTPLGVAVSTAAARFTEAGECDDRHIRDQLTTMAAQVVDFARAQHALRAQDPQAQDGHAQDGHAQDVHAQDGLPADHALGDRLPGRPAAVAPLR
ncbi:NADPH-dependent FMN reductase [Streptomyces sp. MUM 178J]|uniref:NADPH-dependent FMN reductase n=1 Tax=Streptomyces sp. MUM 178J TaxID=2791991 RepID=UPI001F043788|nr:NAD(P)H-dependent oxidoreductase [Streptomyces sp. MUM 178J]WRQ80354.1 NAD(P)H-dependent oxidoreductase [Streptomyces sp. MUM 178J]